MRCPLQYTACAPWLDQRIPVGMNLHRHGWPWVMQELAPACATQRNLTGAILDDFLEQSFMWGGGPELVYTQPFCAIVHNPAEIISPLPSDAKDVCQNVNRSGRWRKSKTRLRGMIALSKHLATQVRKHFGRKVQVLALKHPMEVSPSVQWSYAAYLDKPVCASLGYFLRDTRILYRVPQLAAGPKLYRVSNHLHWQRQRDEALQQKLGKTELHDSVETSAHRLSDEDYDEVRRSCVVVTWLFAASANNVICECIASNTPIICNPLPSVVEYLGAEYPLYASTPEEIAARLSDTPRIRAAHEYLIALDKTWMSRSQFVGECLRFTDRVCR